MEPARRRTLAVVALLVAVVCTGLGVWQLDRLGETRAENERRRERLEAPPVRIGGARGRRALGPADSLAWRRAEAWGRFAYGEEIVLAPRSVSGSPAVYLLTPLVLDSATALPVLRGAVPSPDGFHAPIARAGPPEARSEHRPATTRGSTDHVRGLLLTGPGPREPRGPDTVRAAGRAHRVLAGLDLARVDSLLPWRVPPVYLHADSGIARVRAGDGPPLPIPVPPPEPEDGPHLAYAIQWFSFAAIALVGGLVVLFRAGRAGAD